MATKLVAVMHAVETTNRSGDLRNAQLTLEVVEHESVGGLLKRARKMASEAGLQVRVHDKLVICEVVGA